MDLSRSTPYKFPNDFHHSHNDIQATHHYTQIAFYRSKLTVHDSTYKPIRSGKGSFRDLNETLIKIHNKANKTRRKLGSI